jgi:hypothetical protein
VDLPTLVGALHRAAKPGKKTQARVKFHGKNQWGPLALQQELPMPG